MCCHCQEMFLLGVSFTRWQLWRSCGWGSWRLSLISGRQMSQSFFPQQTAWTWGCASVRKHPWVQCYSVNSAGTPSTACVCETPRTLAKHSCGFVHSASDLKSPHWTNWWLFCHLCSSLACACQRAMHCIISLRGQLAGSSECRRSYSLVIYRNWKRGQELLPPWHSGQQEDTSLTTTTTILRSFFISFASKKK